MGKRHDSFALNGHIIKCHTHSYTPPRLFRRLSTCRFMHVKCTVQSLAIRCSENPGPVAECPLVLIKIILTLAAFLFSFQPNFESLPFLTLFVILLSLNLDRKTIDNAYILRHLLLILDSCYSCDIVVIWASIYMLLRRLCGKLRCI